MVVPNLFFFSFCRGTGIAGLITNTQPHPANSCTRKPKSHFLCLFLPSVFCVSLWRLGCFTTGNCLFVDSYPVPCVTAPLFFPHFSLRPVFCPPRIAYEPRMHPTVLRIPLWLWTGVPFSYLWQILIFTWSRFSWSLFGGFLFWDPPPHTRAGKLRVGGSRWMRFLCF